jgi:hypothetical protein
MNLRRRKRWWWRLISSLDYLAERTDTAQRPNDVTVSSAMLQYRDSDDGGDYNRSEFKNALSTSGGKRELR